MCNFSKISNNIVFVIRSGNKDLLKKQLHLLKKSNLKVIPYSNFPNWHGAHEYLLHILQLQKYEWVINIDLDAFVFSLRGIYRTMKFMKRNNYVISGPPDGGTYTLRKGYPYIFNAFFNIFHMKKIYLHDSDFESLNEKCFEWFNYSVHRRLSECQQIVEDIKTTFPYPITNHNHSEMTEPYYPIFMFLQEKYKHYFFKCNDSEEYNNCPATNVYDPTGQLFLIHTWLGRFYDTKWVYQPFEMTLLRQLLDPDNPLEDNKRRIDFFYEKCNDNYF